MTEIKNLLTLLLLCRNCPLPFTEDVLQSVLFYATLQSITYQNSLLWNETEDRLHWHMRKGFPACKAVSDLLEDRSWVTATQIDARLPVVYELVRRPARVKHYVYFEKVLRNLFKYLKEHSWVDILMYNLNYAGMQRLPEGGIIRFYLK